jgi:hypothetical protein
MFKVKWITLLFFIGQESEEPSASYWVATTSLFFLDPNGHLIEYLVFYNYRSLPSFGIIPYSNGLFIAKD